MNAGIFKGGPGAKSSFIKSSNTSVHILFIISTGSTGINNQNATSKSGRSITSLSK